MNLETQNMDVFKKTINYMFFIYNLKFYANFENKLQGILTNVKRWNGDVAMKLGSGKYANTTFSRGQLTCTYHVELYVATKICELDQEETYKYLETDERNLVQKVKCKKKIRRQCHWRIKAILRTKLNSFNRTEAANTLTTPALQCSFNIISWTLQDLRRTDTKIRKLLTCHRMHHPKADKDQLYHPRCKGGRSLFQVEPKNR